jgi:Ca-activated chloride channel family protein
MRLQDPQFLLLLLLLLPWAWLRLRQDKQAHALAIADGERVARLHESLRARCARYLPLLRLLLLLLLILAMARPQMIERETRVRGHGVDLMIAVDLSTTMLAQEQGASASGSNRLDMAKQVLDSFLMGREGDRIGLIAFAARPYPAAPLTLDHAWLRETVAQLTTGQIEDGTAVGDAILAAINRLRPDAGATRSAAAAARQVPPSPRSQAIIVLTDGRSNAGKVEPVLAAAAAKALGIKVHTIGIGTTGQAVIPMEDPLGGILLRKIRADLDESTLQEIAVTTGGRYFRADDIAILSRVFQEINLLEKRPIESRVFNSYREQFPQLLLAALALGFLELVLRTTVLRQLP